LRHLLKHKRRYAPDALTPAERRVLANKSLLTRIWMTTGKKLYYAITRNVLHVTDREVGGTRLVHDAPRIAASLNAHRKEIVVVAFPDRRWIGPVRRRRAWIDRTRLGDHRRRRLPGRCGAASAEQLQATESAAHRARCAANLPPLSP
jgi:hypothetical protein